MTVTVREVFDLAMETDMIRLAHSIYWAFRERLVELQDDSEMLLGIDYDDPTIDRMTERNALGIGRIQLFVLETASVGWYSFILAENSFEAFHLHMDLFNEEPKNVTKAGRLMIPEMLLADTGEEVSLYEYRKSVKAFPAYVGHAKARQRVLYR
ncbi:diadenosine tetraphosphate (ap4a) hydrolase and other hit family hydrolases [Bacillus sp. OxB-1]|uniref:hypothetical protein n=1 Tax=Bacillus sp. (strain OxB-1) TaxID=98228 RepID=UPI000581C2F5|nr:hypothetical protein [Bacillus sp. OxB-1]BAQ11129.1 diadenosine tetraphosphate (ap4a) hydrolase and other hit family hydrolases [Bacillus sp. OxB-1]